MTNSKIDGNLSNLLAELKRDYEANFPAKIEKLKNLFQQQSWDALGEEFHKLKGTGKTYGFPEVSLLSEALEIHCRTQRIDPTRVEKIFPVFARMQEAWKLGHNFDPQQDPEAVSILILKGPRR